MGYTNVKEYAGGKQDWIDAGLPLESEAEVDLDGAAEDEDRSSSGVT